jgi:NAD(P)-dependent dehydrogenase (short-subunit alcohol dehydrogenase family)
MEANKLQTVLDVKSAYDFDPSATYVIAGGLGGLGRSIARWMVKRGARNLVLLSRFGPREAVQSFLSELREQQVHVEAVACDISNVDTMRSMLANLQKTMPPIKGCINSSMLLKVRLSLFERFNGLLR